MECLVCGGSCTLTVNGVEETCSECEGRGYEIIDHCPQEYLDPEFAELCSYVDMAKQGIMPVAGGALDQSQWFLSFARALWSEDAKAGVTHERDLE